MSGTRSGLRRAALAALLTLGPAGLAHALDGRIQIHQAPYTITKSGSYVLTQDLVVPADTTAITVTADFVTIDLNGFRISGPVTCSWIAPDVTCSGGTSGDGVYSLNQGVVVRNGIITGMGGRGILLGDGARVEDLAVENIGDHGIALGSGGAILRNRLILIDGDAARCQRGCLYAENEIQNVQGSALWTYLGRSLFRENTAAATGLEGIEVDSAGSPRGALAYGNAITDTGTDGIDVWGPAAIYENSIVRAGSIGVVARETGSLVSRNAVQFSGGAGVDAGAHSLVMENSIKDNGGVGITEVGALTLACGNNVLNFNNSNGAQWNDCVSIGTNVCRGSTTCP